MFFHFFSFSFHLMDTSFATVYGVDTLWVIVAAALVFFMQAGFAMLEAGFTRARSAINVLMKNLMDVSFGMIVFYLIGFTFMFGTGAFIGMGGFGIEAIENPVEGSLSLFAFFFFQAAFAATAATIVSGAIAERAKFYSYVFISIAITVFIYPVVGHWVWGGGWLSTMATPFHDFAGSTVVHSVGGWASLVAAIIIGPRLGRFDKKSGNSEFDGHNIPIAALGTFILWFGWYGFNAGSNLAISSVEAANAVGLIAVNTTLAAAAGAVVTTLLSTLLLGKPSAGIMLNGTLGGLVAITAGCDAVSPMSAITIGIIGGAAVYFATEMLATLKIDDVVGAFPVHGVGGIVGTLCVGLFATDGGLFLGGGTALFVTQIIGVVSVAAWVILTSYIVISVLKVTVGVRVSKEDELAGIDITKHGISAYPQFEATKDRI